jgi:hypothetical protein
MDHPGQADREESLDQDFTNSISLFAPAFNQRDFPVKRLRRSIA